MIPSLTDLIQSLESPHQVDLDELKTGLENIARQVTEREQTAQLYELELQREVRAKVDLCGGITGCPRPEVAFELTGQALLAARRDIIHKFNEVFFMAPLCRNTQKPNPAAR